MSYYWPKGAERGEEITNRRAQLVAARLLQSKANAEANAKAVSLAGHWLPTTFDDLYPSYTHSHTHSLTSRLLVTNNLAVCFSQSHSQPSYVFEHTAMASSLDLCLSTVCIECQQHCALHCSSVHRSSVQSSSDRDYVAFFLALLLLLSVVSTTTAAVVVVVVTVFCFLYSTDRKSRRETMRHCWPLLPPTDQYCYVIILQLLQRLFLRSFTSPSLSRSGRSQWPPCTSSWAWSDMVRLCANLRAEPTVCACRLRFSAAPATTATAARGEHAAWPSTD